jgi:hypothetical protein
MYGGVKAMWKKAAVDCFNLLTEKRRKSVSADA